MNRKKYLIILLIVVVGIISFTSACGGTGGQTETEIVKEVKEEPVEVKEEPVEVTISDEASKDAEYMAGSIVLSNMVVETMQKAGDASSDAGEGLISIAEYKVRMSEHVSDINNCYDVYLDLEPSERFKSSYEQFGEAMKHYLNSATYMEQLVETDDIDDMITYMRQATSELKLGTSYMNKATTEVDKLSE